MCVAHIYEYVRWVRWVDAFGSYTWRQSLLSAVLHASLMPFFLHFFNGPEYFPRQRMEERIRSSWDDQSTRNWLKLNFDEFRQTTVVRFLQVNVPLLRKSLFLKHLNLLKLLLYCFLLKRCLNETAWYVLHWLWSKPWFAVAMVKGLENHSNGI